MRNESKLNALGKMIEEAKSLYGLSQCPRDRAELVELIGSLMDSAVMEMSKRA